MRSFKPYLSALILVTALSGCQSMTNYEVGAPAYTHNPTPDHRIKLMPSADGRTMRAVGPDCIGWQDDRNSFNVNQRMPQLGCSQARNLAAQIDRPMDLVNPRELGQPDATISAASITAYRSGKTKALIDPNAEAPSNDATTGAGAAASALSK